MTIYQFLSAEKEQQFDCFLDAVDVGERVEGKYKIVCRQFNDFYIEFKFLHGVFVENRVFKNPDLLEPYLEQIIVKLRE